MSVKTPILCVGLCVLLAQGCCGQAWAVGNLKQVEERLATQKQRENALKEEERKTEATIDQLRQRLIEATDSLQAKEKESEALETKYDALAEANKTKTKKLQVEQRHLKDLMSSLLELSREPPEALLLHTTLTTEQIHRGILLRELLPRVQDATESVASDLSELSDMRERLAQQKKLVTTTQQNLAWQKKNLDDLIRIRQGSLQKTAEEREALAKQLSSLSAEAQDLRQLMQKVSVGMALPKSVEKDTRMVRLNNGLKMPVGGKIIRPFGSRDVSGVTSQGLTFIALGGSRIVAPMAGRVVFAGIFRGYGQIVILAHKGGYHSFLAGFGRIDIEMGQEISAGEPLGVLPDSVLKPELYFEWRFRNDPIDPCV